MSDYQGQYDAQNDAPPQQADAEDWAAAGTAYLQRTGHGPGPRDLVVSPTTGKQYLGMPPGYVVADGKVQRQGWWSEWGKGAALTLGAGLGAGYGLGALNAAGAGTGTGASIVGNPALSTPLESFGGTLPATQTAPFAAAAATPTATGANLAGGFGSAATAVPAAGGTMSTIDRLLKYAKPALAGASVIGGLTQGNQPTSSPEMDQLLQMQIDRMKNSNPLYEQVLQGAFGRLPTSATQGLQAPSLAGAESQVPPVQTGGNYKETQQQRELLRQQEIRMKAGDPVYQAIQKLAQSRLRK